VARARQPRRGGGGLPADRQPAHPRGDAPVAYEIGHRLLPLSRVPERGRLPPWLGALLPIAEEALVGGALLGMVAGALAYAVTRHALRTAGSRFKR
jgi:hypothetical protein